MPEKSTNRHMRSFSGMLLCALLLLLCSCSSSQTATAQLPSSDRMGGTHQPFECNSDGYFVQVASEVKEEQGYIARVDQVRDLGQLPVNTHYVTENYDCGIFSDERSWVLYAGPFATADAACPALLQSPPDASIKGLRSETRRANSPCLCAVNLDDIPALLTPNETGQWVSEVQRSLLDVGYPIGKEIVVHPGQLSELTSDTIGKFQDAVGLSATGLVDKTTWERLQVVICG